MRPITDRFWEKVDIRDNDLCWEWQASIRRDGYGVLRIAGHGVAAHRISWELHHKQSVPKGMFVLHKCDNRRCVNPYHLFLGTHQDNMDDILSKGRRNAAKGERNGSAKLTYDKVEQIKKLNSTGQYSRRQLARMFGLKAHAAINKIINGITWVG